MSNVDAARSVYKAFAAGDLDAVTGAMSSDVRWEEPPSAPYGSHTGPEAIVREVFYPVFHQFDEFRSTPEEWIDGGEVVVVLGRYWGRARETGKTLDTPFVHVWRFEDGKVTGFRTSFDTFHWLEVIGQANT